MKALVAALTLLLASACGVPTERHATKAPRAALPPDEGAQPEVSAPRAAEQSVFLVRDTALVARSRRLRTPTLRSALDALFTGPTQEEVDEGIRSAIPADASLEHVGLDAGIATLSVNDAFLDLGTTEQTLAVGQVVFTATAFPGVAGVLFAGDGNPVEVTRPDGTVIRGPASRADFQSLLAPEGR